MRVYLNRCSVERNQLYGRYSGKSVRLAIDSSKTNSALLVMNRYYKPIDVFEFNGSEDTDVLDLTAEQRVILDKILEGAKVLEVGIEDIITKKEETGNGKFSGGLRHHYSRFVITAVFFSFIMYAQDYKGVKADLHSNQSWKAAVLPKELNKKGVYKGSYDYIKDKYGSKYLTGSRAADNDVTDVFCIGEYMKLKAGLSIDDELLELPDEKELPSTKYTFAFTSSIPHNITNTVKFVISDKLTVDDNAAAISNRLKDNQYGCAVISIEDVTIEEIYTHVVGTFEEVTSALYLIVKRC